MRSAAIQCQGTAMARNNGRPNAACKRRQGEKSREYAEYRSSTAAGMTAATSPLVRTPSAAAPQATNIQRRCSEREGEPDTGARCARRKPAALNVM